MRLSTHCLVALSFAAAIGAARAELPLPVDGGEAASVPMAVLSAGDVSLYQQIFDDEHEGRFDEAHKLFARLTDTSLEGYVVAEHYLSSHRHTTLAELTEWLRTYPDLPIADRIYRLAVARGSKKVHKRHHKTVIVMTAHVPAPAGPAHWRGGGYEENDPPDPPLSSDGGRTAQGRSEERRVGKE